MAKGDINFISLLFILDDIHFNVNNSQPINLAKLTAQATNCLRVSTILQHCFFSLHKLK